MTRIKSILLVLICCTTAFTGCKKDKLQGDNFSTQTIAGRWEVTSSYYKRYYDDAFVSESTPEDINLEYEFTANGNITIYEDGNAETGTYSITQEGSKNVYFNSVRGRTGAFDDGAGEIEVTDKNNIRLLFKHSSDGGLKPGYLLYIEVLHRK